MIPTTVRVVCQNTLNLALRESGVEGLTISHHPRLESRIAEARAKLGIIAARFDKFDEELHAMLAKELTRHRGGRILPGNDRGRTFPTARIGRRRPARRFSGRCSTTSTTSGTRLPGVKHTAWGAYNAVSEWADHQRKYRGHHPPTSWTGNWIPFGSAQSHQLKQAAYRGALELAGVAARRPLPEPAPVLESRGGLGSGCQCDAAQPSVAISHKGDSSWPATTE